MSPQAAEAGSPSPATIHATALLIGETGVLIRGSSGAGKSSLALALIEACRQGRRFACLVGDDRIRLTNPGGRLVARPHPAIAGLVERRGQGIVAVAHERAALIRCIIDLVPGDRSRDIPPRLPETGDSVADIGRIRRDLGYLPSVALEEGLRQTVAWFRSQAALDRR